jgi:hypothetical protein
VKTKTLSLKQALLINAPDLCQCSLQSICAKKIDFIGEKTPLVTFVDLPVLKAPKKKIKAKRRPVVLTVAAADALH